MSSRPSVECSELETDLVRRPRVRGTAPQATVGKERRLSLSYHDVRLSGIFFVLGDHVVCHTNGWFPHH